MAKARAAKPWRWAVPQKAKIPADELKARIDVYSETVTLSLYEHSRVKTRPVSANEVAMAFLSRVTWSTGILPKNALWYVAGQGDLTHVALWEPARIWTVALQLAAFDAPRRLRLPMPGLVFICHSLQPPKVFAAKKRPADTKAQLYHAPLFNVFHDGRTCPGTQRYSADVTKHPWEFMASFFTHAADSRGRSRTFPDSLLDLWNKLDGTKRYPASDLLEATTPAQLMESKR